MPGVHAKLSASGSKRWLACPGSVVLEALYPETESPYAEEGTRAHALAERLLLTMFGLDIYAADCSGPELNADAEMARNVKAYVDYCVDLYDSLRLKYKRVSAFIEERVNYDKWVPKGFGSIDCILLAGDELNILDLKYGKGVPVSAEDNPQPRLYALGAIQEYGDIYDIKHVTTHIVQPRLNSITTETLTRQELEEWGLSIKEAAETAYGNTRAYQAGDHCQFCRARATCRERATHYLSSILKILGGQNDGNSAD